MKLNLHIFALFFTVALGYCQGSLPNFTLTVNTTDETCLGNGSLQITASNTVPGATITYFTYKLPDTVTPIANTSTVNGLSSGNYRVVVTQSLDDKSNTQQKDVVIANKIVDLDFKISADVTSGCGQTGTIVVMITAGTAEFYEIIKGPVTFPKQTSNTFHDLPEGQYRIRVFDKCGEALVRDYTLVILSPSLQIGETNVPKKLTSCTTVTVSNLLNADSGTKIIYPLEITYTIYPPNGTPIKTVVKEIATGSDELLNLSQALDLYGSADFTYDLKVTDGCGNIFSLNDNHVGPFPKVDFYDILGVCGGKFLMIDVAYFSPGYTVKFTKAPSGFDPKSFNNNHPGAFSELMIVYGSLDNPVPIGQYEIEITDACGRVSQKVMHKVELDMVEPFSQALNAGCDSQFGSIKLNMPDGSKVVSVVITKAPSNYPSSLPSNVSSFINSEGVFFIQNIAVGKYDLTVTDDCNRTHLVKDIEVPVFVKQGLLGESLPNCVPGSGSVLVWSGNGNLKTVQITKAPENFGKELPYDVTNNLFEGQLLMSDLPTGDYEFEGVDICDYNLVLELTVAGYDRDLNGFTVERNCGSFNLVMEDGSNGVYKQAYWLQSFNPSANVWEHPFTGTDYVEGTVPDSNNSFALTNHSTTYNLSVTGIFRVIKNFQTYSNTGIPQVYKDCVEVLGQFEYTDDLRLVGVYSLDCAGGPGPMSVVVDVVGVPPYTYKITEKDGDTSFVIDNGNESVFTDLNQGTYNFQIEDSCGGLKNGKYTVGALPDLVEANTPNTMLICGDGSEESAVFDLTQQTAVILGFQNPNAYKVTYYLNSPDAENGTNAIENPNFYLNTTNPETIYARVVHTEIALCYDTTSFEIYLGITPVLSNAPEMFLCEGESLTITADSGYDAYLWSTGEMTESITVTQPGTYNVIVKDFYGDMSCDTSKDFPVTGSGLAKIEKVEVNDWSVDTNSLNVIVSGVGDYEYSLDNENFQDENVFTNVQPGPYTVYVRDKMGCGTVSANVLVLSFQKYFTPNGDGNNDKWNIDFSILEPGIKVYIYDRFGKMVSTLDSQSSGWDGTYNGVALPSTDYWFVAERPDGRVYKGHFSMKR